MIYRTDWVSVRFFLSKELAEKRNLALQKQLRENDTSNSIFQTRFSILFYSRYFKCKRIFFPVVVLYKLDQ